MNNLNKLYGISGDNSFVMMQWVQGKLVPNNIVVGDYNPDTTASKPEIISKVDLQNWVIKNFDAHKDDKVK
jgi:hypothetical protein